MVNFHYCSFTYHTAANFSSLAKELGQYRQVRDRSNSEERQDDQLGIGCAMRSNHPPLSVLLQTFRLWPPLLPFHRFLRRRFLHLINQLCLEDGTALMCEHCQPLQKSQGATFGVPGFPKLGLPRNRTFTPSQAASTL